MIFGRIWGQRRTLGVRHTVVCETFAVIDGEISQSRLCGVEHLRSFGPRLAMNADMTTRGAFSATHNGKPHDEIVCSKVSEPHSLHSSIRPENRHEDAKRIECPQLSIECPNGCRYCCCHGSLSRRGRHRDLWQASQTAVLGDCEVFIQRRQLPDPNPNPSGSAKNVGAPQIGTDSRPGSSLRNHLAPRSV